MAVVAGLFDSQAEASAALDALAETEFEDVTTEVYEQAPDPDDSNVAAVPDLGTSRILATPYAPDFLDELDEAERRFFVQAVRNGATLVVAEVDDEQAGALAAFFRERGGRTTAEE